MGEFIRYQSAVQPNGLSRVIFGAGAATFPPDYLLNRIGGGAVTGMRGIFIAAEMKRRQLVEPPAVQQ